MTLTTQLVQILHTLRPSTVAHTALTTQSTLDDVGIDSLDRIRLAAALETSYGITISGTALADVHRLGDLAALLDTRCPGRASTELVAVDPVPAPRPVLEHLSDAFLHPTADLGAGVQIGLGSRVWRRVLIADQVRVGTQCTLGTGVHLGAGTRVGNRVKIQNLAQVFGADIRDEVLLCPGVLIVEDAAPRATTSMGTPQEPGDWTPDPVTVGQGATVGAGAILLPGVRIGAYAMIAAGTVVDHDVPAHALIAGNPHRHVGWACRCGQRLRGLTCGHCGTRYQHRTPETATFCGYVT